MFEIHIATFGVCCPMIILLTPSGAKLPVLSVGAKLSKLPPFNAIFLIVAHVFHRITYTYPQNITASYGCVEVGMFQITVPLGRFSGVTFATGQLSGILIK